MKTIVKSCKVETLKACGRKAATTLLTLLTFLTLQRIPASGQTNLPANPSQSFFQSVGGYLTSINTNYSFASNTFEVSIGAGESGPILANYVAAQYDLGKWDIAAQARNAGVAGVIQTAEVGGGYSVIRSGDTKLQIGALAGYDWNKSALLFEPQLVLRKKVTKNTFFETGISLPEWTTGPLNKTPALFIGTGFTY